MTLHTSEYLSYIILLRNISFFANEPGRPRAARFQHCRFDSDQQEPPAHIFRR